MTQLITSDGYEFLTKAGLSVQEIGSMVMGVYEWATEEEYPYNITNANEFIPSKYQIISSAYNSFDHLCFDYIMNGHHPYMKEAILEQMDAGETRDDIEMGWLETRDYNGSFGTIPTDCLESEFMRDINKALMQFHICYMKDNFVEEKFYAYNEFHVENTIINAPIVGVW